MIWESILAKRTNGNYRVSVWKREWKKERMRNLTVVDVLFFSASVGACFPKQGNHTQPLPYPLMSSCLWPIRASDWPAILFQWFCQLYVNVLSLHTARPQWVLFCVRCALAAVPAGLYEQVRGCGEATCAFWECVNIFFLYFWYLVRSIMHF